MTNYGNGLDDPSAGGDNNLAMLEKSIPGVPGQDYPILAEVPESSFSCDGQVDGGKLGISDLTFKTPNFILQKLLIHSIISQR